MKKQFFFNNDECIIHQPFFKVLVKSILLVVTLVFLIYISFIHDVQNSSETSKDSNVIKEKIGKLKENNQTAKDALTNKNTKNIDKNSRYEKISISGIYSNVEASLKKKKDFNKTKDVLSKSNIVSLKNIEELKKEVKELKKRLDDVSSEKLQEFFIKTLKDERIDINESLREIYSSIKNIELERDKLFNNLLKNRQDIVILNKRLEEIAKSKMDRNLSYSLEEEIKTLRKDISKLNSKVSGILSSDEYLIIKNNSAIIKRMEEEVKKIFSLAEKKIKEINDLKMEMNKIKDVVQGNIKANINVVKEIENLKKEVKTLYQKQEDIANKKITEMQREIEELKKEIALLKNKKKNENTQYQKRTELDIDTSNRNLSKSDYISLFGFYYAGYSKDSQGPTGYISDTDGKIYEVRIGDIINNRFKVVKINPLYLKIEDIQTSKSYVVSYKR